MLDELDDSTRPKRLRARREPTPDASTQQRFTAARLVSRVYRTASAPLRADMLACLLRPLGTLSLVAVASGAFAGLLQRSGTAPERVLVHDTAQFSSDQILELATFVHEASPVAFEQLTTLLIQHPMGVTAFSASALLLMYTRLRDSSPARARAPD